MQFGINVRQTSVCRRSFDRLKLVGHQTAPLPRSGPNGTSIFGEHLTDPRTIVLRHIYHALPKVLASEFEFHQLCDQLESGQLDGVNLESVPADEAQRISH